VSIGERLKQCRLALGYSAEVVAEKLGISPATMYRYENGDIEKMPARLLDPLAHILNTTPAFLMGWSSEGAPAAPVILSDEDARLLHAFHAADPAIQSAVRKLLDIPEGKENGISQSAI
jgi:transcriptional regulator with XRE-family HTH domain